LVPDDSITTITPDELPPNWDQYPAPSILAEIGDDWAREGKTMALHVPSCIIDKAFNCILNCNHRDYERVKVLNLEPFKMDARLAGKRGM
jgi:hypothetical protein